jgi:methanogenic corrinoid protein MtbC1
MQPAAREDESRFPLTEKSIESFRHALPRLFLLVNERFMLETKLSPGGISPEQQELIRDAHTYFGELLLGIYEFQLYEDLEDEFSWYISTLFSQGCQQEYVRSMIKAWILAIHSIIKPPESDELVKPLEWVYKRIPSYCVLLEEKECVLTEEVKYFLDLLLRKERRSATEYILSLYRKGGMVEHIYSQVLTPVLAQIGLLRHKSAISFSDEHAATDICRYVILRLFDSIPREKELPYRAVVSCVPGEEHELGAEILANYLEIKGWKVFFIGHGAPQKDIVQAIMTDKPDIIFLSVILISHLPAAKALLQNIREMTSPAKVVAGGQAAVRARKTLGKFADAITNSIEEAHTRSLELVARHA